MKRNDITQLHDKSIAELEQQVVELRKQLAQVRLERAVGKSAVSAVQRLGDDVARVKTVLHEKKLTQALAASVTEEAPQTEENKDSE